MTSDAMICFLDLLPRPKPGVLVHFHDIFLPEDYAPEWATRYHSEQYLFAAYLLAGARKIEITCPNRFITFDPELSAVLQPLWDELPGVERHGSSFWLTTT